MALEIIGRNNLAVATRGAVGKMAVIVRENGQVGFSTLAAKSLEGFNHCIIGWEREKREMVITPVHVDKMPKGVPADLALEIGRGKKGGIFLKGGGHSVASLFALPQVNYDFVKAGTQSFEAKNGGGKLSFHLPTNDKVVAREKKPRKARAKKGASATGATATTQASANDEPQLEQA